MSETTYHDLYFRNVMSNLTIAKNFLKCYLPQHIQNKIDLNSLRLCKENYVSSDLTEKVVDVLYAANFKKGEGFIYILVEHQSSQDIMMPLRILEYEVKIMASHVKQTHEKTLPIVVPLVFYHGKGAYRHSTDIFDLFGDQKKLAQGLMFKPFQLIDLNTISDEKIRENKILGLMQFAFKHIWARDFLPHLEKIALDLKHIEYLGENDYINATVNYARDAGNISNPEAFVDLLRKTLTPATGEKTDGNCKRIFHSRRYATRSPSCRS